MKKILCKYHLDNFISIVYLFFPGIFMLFNWLILKRISNDFEFYYLAGATILIIIMSLKNTNGFFITLVSIFIFNLFNFQGSLLCRDSSFMFPCFYENIVTMLNIIWSVLYLILFCLKNFFTKKQMII